MGFLIYLRLCDLTINGNGKEWPGKSVSVHVSENGRQWAWGVIFNFSFLFLKSLHFKKCKTLIWQQRLLPLHTQYYHTLLSLPVSLLLSSFDSYRSTPFISTLISSMSSFFFSFSSFTLFTPSPITVKLQGGWLETSLTEKFGSDQNH